LTTEKQTGSPRLEGSRTLFASISRYELDASVSVPGKIVACMHCALSSGRQEGGDFEAVKRRHVEATLMKMKINIEKRKENIKPSMACSRSRRCVPKRKAR
jgi:hypothetical protein